MKKTGIFYGSTTGSTEDVAGRIATRLGIAPADVRNVSDLSPELVAGYDVLLLGCSTWGAGDLQDDWYDALDRLRAVDLTGKIVALFGCGDAGSYPDTFCGALGQLYDALAATGCTFVGSVPTDGYDFADSEAVRDGSFVGLPIDEMNEPDKTDTRLAAWCEELKEVLA